MSVPPPGPIFGLVFVSLAPAGLAPTYIWTGFGWISHRSTGPHQIFGPMLAEFHNFGPVDWIGLKLLIFDLCGQTGFMPDLFLTYFLTYC